MGISDYCSCCNEYATWQVMEEYLPTDLLRSYKKLFKECDVESTGVISVEKVARVARKLGKCLTTVEIKELLMNITECSKCNQVDIKFVDFPEFLAIISATATNCVSEDQMLSIFNKFDQNGDGFIGRQELQNLLLKVGEKVSEAEIDEMMRIADKDGDGRVSYEEFVRLLTGSCNNTPTQSCSLSCVVKANKVNDEQTLKIKTGKNTRMIKDNFTIPNTQKSKSCNGSPVIRRDESMRRILKNGFDKNFSVSQSSNYSSSSTGSLSSEDSGIALKNHRKFSSPFSFGIKAAFSKSSKSSIDFNMSF